MLSELSIAKSNYEIKLVKMQDSLVIMEKDKKSIERMNDEY